MDNPETDGYISSLIAFFMKFFRFGGYVSFLIAFFERFFRFGASGYAVQATRDSAFKIPPKEVITQVVYEIQPAPDNPNVEIVFFHGFELGDYRDAYWKDWLSHDESHCWLGSWLIEEFPHARILTVSYDSSLKTTHKEGRGDLHVIAQNLVSTLIRFGGSVGQRNCPVVLVGHSMGGLVMKKLMVMVNSAISQGKRKSGEEEVALESFFGNVKGLFFYATPHKGSRLAESMKNSAKNSQLLQTLQILGTEIGLLQEGFMDLCNELKWILYGLGESYESKLGHDFSGTVVERASAEAGMGANFTMVWEDHFSICKPRKKEDTSFETLAYFIDKVIKRQSSNNSLERTDISLPFPADNKYVPLRETITKVRQALENKTNGQVVILHGGSGAGKTSMARYLALFYAGALDACSSNPMTKFGKRVYFLSCGGKKGGQIFPLLVHLWENMGFGNTTLNLQSCGDASSNTDERTSQCERLRRDIKKNLKQKHVLIVLDNVWDTELLQELLIPSENIKYLVTTQKQHIWMDGRCPKIKICKPSFEEAQQIFMNHIEMSSGEIRQHLQPHFAELIKGCDSSPLQMANVAGTIKHDKVLKKSWWRTTKKDLKDLVDGVPGGVTLFNRTYSSGTFSNATSLAVNSFGEEARTLLCIAAICDSSLDIPEIVFRMFYKVVHPKMTAFSLRCDDLVGSDFIKIDNKDQNNDLGWSFDFPETTWSIHENRQHEIRNMKNCKVKVDSIVGEILESKITTNDRDVLQAFLFLYGQERWRKQVAEKLDIVLNTNNLMQARDHMELFIFLLDSNGEEESHIHVSKVILHYVRTCELDDQAMSKLCMIHEIAGAACLALRRLLLLVEKPLLTGEHRLTVKALMVLKQDTLPTLLKLLHRDVESDVQSSAAWSIGNLAHDEESMALFGKNPEMLETLIGLIGKEGVQLMAIYALRRLCFSLDNAVRVVSFPGALRGLVTLLGRDQDPEVQVEVVGTLSNITGKMVSNKIALEQCPGAIQGLVRLLATDMIPQVQKGAALTIGNLASENSLGIKLGSFPGLVQGLVTLLNKDIDPHAQEDALKGLGNIAGASLEVRKILGADAGALQNLTRILGFDCNPALQEKAAGVIKNIAYSDMNSREADLEYRGKVGSFPGLVGALVALLDKNIDPNVQKSALEALANITHYSVVNQNIVGAYPGALRCLTMLLAINDRTAIQREAARAIANIASVDLESRRKVGSFTGLIDGLIRLLGKDSRSAIQEESQGTLGALGNMTSSGLEVEKYAALCALSTLCLSPENAVRVASVPGAVETLVPLLGKEQNPDIQLEVLEALAHITMVRRTTVEQCPGAVQGLVGLLGMDVSFPIQQTAAVIIQNLAFEQHLGVKLGSFPGVVEGLVALLDGCIDPTVQEAALGALANITNGASSNREAVAVYPGALQCLTRLLAFHDRPAIQAEAARAIANIASADLESRSTVGSFVGITEGLIKLVRKDTSPTVQELTLWALIAITDCLPGSQTRVGLFPGFLEALLTLLKKDVDKTVQTLGYQLLSSLCESAQVSMDMRARPDSLEQLAEILERERNLEHTQLFVALSLTLIDTARADKVVLRSSEAHKGRGYGKLLRGLYKGALGDFNFAMEIKQERDPSLLCWQCFARAMIEDYSEALEDVNQAVQLSPKCPTCWQERGVVKRLIDDLDGALSDLNRGLELGPNDYEILKQRGFVKFLRGDEEGACIDGELASKLKFTATRVSGSIISCLGQLPVRYLGFEL